MPLEPGDRLRPLMLPSCFHNTPFPRYSSTSVEAGEEESGGGEPKFPGLFNS